MPNAHFDAYEIRDVSDFFMHTFLSLKKNCGELPLGEALKAAADRAYHIRLESGDDAIVNSLLRLEDAFLQKLRSKVTSEMTWENCIKTVNEVIAEIKHSLTLVS